MQKVVISTSLQNPKGQQGEDKPLYGGDPAGHNPGPNPALGLLLTPVPL